MAEVGQSLVTADGVGGLHQSYYPGRALEDVVGANRESGETKQQLFLTDDRLPREPCRAARRRSFTLL